MVIIQCFDSFVSEDISKEIDKIRIQVNDSKMWGYFCTGFIDFMLNNKRVADFTNIFSLNNLKSNDKIIRKIFQ